METLWARVGYQQVNDAIHYSIVPTGAAMAFDLATCPTGWTELTTARGRALVGAGQGAGLTDKPRTSTGGSETVMLAANQVPTLTGSVSGTATASNVSLIVSASAHIGASAPSSKTNALVDKNLLTAPANSGVAIYAPPGSTTDRQIGPDGAVTGTANGTINADMSGGTSSYQNASQAAISTTTPYLAVLYCRKD